MMKAPVCLRYQRSTDRTPDKCRHTDDGEQRAVPDANLPDVTDLGNQGRDQGYDRAGAETVEHGKDNDRSVRCTRQPERQHDDGRKVGHEDHDVKTTNPIGYIAGYGSAEDTDAGGQSDISAE